LRYRQQPRSVPPVGGLIETCTTFEIEGTGTRITITHSGFGDGDQWDFILESMSAGSDESVADLILYLETGVGFPRHPVERGYHGIQAHEVPAGLVVYAVEPDTFATRLGLQRGDLLVELGGAPVFGYRELWTIARASEPGTETSAAWVRDRALYRGTAALGRRPTASVAG
jgi:hypothetical protein